MKIAAYRVRTLNKRVPKFILDFLQIFSAAVTEMLNIILICQYTDPKDIVTNYVQFGFIAEIDNLYSKTLKNNFFMELLNFTKIKTKSTEEECEEIKTESKKSILFLMTHIILKYTYRFFKVIYSSFYFYYAPFTVIVLSMFTLKFEKDLTP